MWNPVLLHAGLRGAVHVVGLRFSDTERVGGSMSLKMRTSYKPSQSGREPHDQGDTHTTLLPVTLSPKRFLRAEAGFT